MATTTPNYGWSVPTSTDLVTNGATAIETLGDAIDASMNTALGTKKAGMVLLNTTSFSGVSSQSINDVFSATYNYYRIILVALGSTTTQSVNLRLRVSGADNSSTNYRRESLVVSSTSVSSARYTGETSWLAAAGAVSSTEENFNILEIANPFQTAYTTAMKINSYDTSGNIELNPQAYGINVTTSYTGFTLIPASGTMTGSVSVYGFNK
jgi:hypothetical protein